MKKADIKIGSVYRAKVSGKLADLRIDAEHPSGGWTATNLATRKQVRVKSAQRLRAPAASQKAVAAADQENARLRDERTAAANGMTASERAMATSAPKRKQKPDATEKARKEAIAAIDRNLDGKPGKKPKPAKAAAKAKRAGILDCAVAVLQGAGEPLGCREMVQAMLERKLWATNGKTPSATLYAAILRELQHKGKQARFEKVARGRFTLRKGV